ncbi:MAG: hypothetical protein AB7O43_02870 [Hyphomicrobiaceae bacterium]
MNQLISRTAVALNPIVAVLIIVAGAVAGEYLASNSVGLAFGAITGLVVALPLCGGVSLLSTIEEQSRPQPLEGVQAKPKVAGLNGQGSSTVAAKAASAGEEDDVSYVSEAEQVLLHDGEFGAYHLSRAKRFLDAGKYKDAVYQASACLAHDTGNVEAVALRDEAKARRNG